jgi:hypothetical protein
MSLSSSNTYIEPVSGSSLNIARIDVNRSLRAILSNFKSTSRPAGINLVAGGGNIGEQDGMLYRSATTNALYISDSVHVKSSPVGGNFTRVGIGNRIENGIVALGANATSYEIGELVATVSQDGTLSANARLYLCVSNTVTANSTAGFLDVGAPLGYSIGTNDNVTFTGQSVTAIRFLATSNVGINTVSPATSLHVNGDVTITDRIIRAGSTSTQIRLPAANTVSIETSNSERIRITPAGNVGIGTSTPTARLHIFNNQGGANGRILLDANVSSGYDTTIFSTDIGLEFTAESNTRGFVFKTGVSPTEKVRINPSGNVGIGTSSPSTELDVVGTVRATDFNSVSDIALKDDIQIISDALTKLKAISGYTFRYKDTNKKGIGVLAQEIEQIFPEAVSGLEGNKSVAYGNLVGLLIEAVKELSNKIDKLDKTR